MAMVTKQAQAELRVKEEKGDVEISNTVKATASVGEQTIDIFLVHLTSGRVWLVRGDNGVVWDPARFWKDVEWENRGERNN